ncbi:MAG TPA: rhodanese-like domain-containing protein [Candidatus Omnitrophota bacterium]|nr:rhodanese-like domain-containing protein [Candidatus Omnitrophota bacterium]
MLNRLFGNIFPAAPESDNVRIVDAAEIKRWVEAGEVALFDVREPNEYAVEHIAGACNLPLSSFDPAKVLVPEGKKLVIHCRSGARCGMAAARMVAAGYTGEINRMQGGIFGWKSVGGPTRTGG